MTGKANASTSRAGITEKTKNAFLICVFTSVSTRI
jgi:hypothetical protein